MVTTRAIVRGKETSDGVLFKLREDGKIVYRNIPLKNFFYVLQEDWRKVEFLVRNEISSVEEFVDREGTAYVRLYLTDNFKRWSAKDKIENAGVYTFESDVNAVLRFCTMNDLSWNATETLKVGYFDLETRDLLPFKKDHMGNVIAQEPIMSCAIGPQSGNKDDILYLTNENVDDIGQESEKKLLMQIFDELREYDIVSAWNAEGFDIPYLKQRQELLGLDDYFDWSFINTMDDLKIFKQFYDREYKSYSLNNVANQFIGEEKIKLQYDDETKIKYTQGNFYRMFKEQPDLFKKYNIKDVELMQQIEKKAKNYVPKLVLAKLTQAFVQETSYNSVLGDHTYLRKAHLHGVVSTRKPTKEEKLSREMSTNPGGGYTGSFDHSLHFNVESFDLKSHYPLIIITNNISPETFVSDYDVDFEEIASFLTKEELELVIYTLEIKKNHLKKSGELKSSYDKAIDKYIKEKQLKFSPEDVMFKIVDNYKGLKCEAFAKSHNYSWTAADYNHDVLGWTFHPHRLFKRAHTGLFPMMCNEAISTRDAVKYEIKRKSKEDVNYVNSPDHMSAHYHQIAVKVLANSYFGILGATHTRFYNYSTVDTVTCVGRWIIKKLILFSKKYGYDAILCDTDSIFIDVHEQDDEKRMKIVKNLNGMYFDFFIELFSRFNTSYSREATHPVTGEKVTLNHWCNFEWEHTFAGLLSVKKKRYYYMEEFADKEGHKKFKVETRGGAFLKNDTNPLAAEKQKQLCEDLFTKKYDKEAWYNTIKTLHELCMNHKLDAKYLVFSKKYTKSHELFGQTMIDSETGLPKVSASGDVRMAPIPVHIKLVKRLIESGQNYNVGDTISFIIKEPTFTIETKVYKSGKTKEMKVFEKGQQGITPEEYSLGARYDADTYWRRISGPIMEILNVVEDKKYIQQLIDEFEVDVKDDFEEEDE